jgi:hypothetical protein
MANVGIHVAATSFTHPTPRLLHLNIDVVLRGEHFEYIIFAY